MEPIILVIVVLMACFAFANWQTGLAICTVMGLLLQDPLRKIIPGQPLYFVLFSGLVLAAACLGAFNSRVSLLPSVIPGWRENLSRPFNLFLFLVVCQAIHSFAVFWDVRMTGIGLMVWLGPITALMFSFQFAGYYGFASIQRWMLIYAGAVSVCALTVILQFIGVESRWFGEVGAGVVIYDVGRVLVGNSGLLRSSELAAWHISAAAGVIFVILVTRSLSGIRLSVALIAMALFLGTALLTGRRKSVIEIGMFIVIYFLVLVWYQRRSIRQLLVCGTMLCSLLIALLIDTSGDFNAHERTPSWQDRVETIGAYESYIIRGGTVLADVPARIAGLGFAPVQWAVESLGWFGSGLGTGSAGTGGFDDQRRNTAAAEGGLGKIVIELGVPGLILVAWLIFRAARFVNQLLEDVSRISLQHARTAYGLLAILLAKTSSFAVASQAFSDPFVLIIMGTLSGYLIALPFLARGTLSQAAPHIASSTPLSRMSMTAVHQRQMIFTDSSERRDRG